MEPKIRAFTGCDTVSSFSGRSKKTAWSTWNVYPDVTKAFEELQMMLTGISELAMKILEQFVVQLYDHTSDIMSEMIVGSICLHLSQDLYFTQ